MSPRPNPVYSDAPYTVRGNACGEQGSHIHFTPGEEEHLDETESLFCLPGFLNDSSLYGAAGKVVVQEWAKLRWGVFEEHGYPGDQRFPLFFYKVFII